MDLVIQPNLTTVNNVALGQVFSVDMPIGPAYDFIDLVVTMTSASAKTVAAITDFLDLITVQINAKAQRTFKATEMDLITGNYGAGYTSYIFNSTGSGNTLAPIYSGGVPQAAQANSQTTAIFRIYFQEPWRKTWAGANYRRLFTSWPAPKGGQATVLSSFQIQGLIPSTTNNAGATSVSVLVYAGTENVQGLLDASGNPVNNMLKIYRNPISYTAAGDQNLTNFVKYAKGAQLAICEEIDIFPGSSATDQVNRVQVTADSRKVRDVTVGINNDDLVRHGFNSPWNVALFPVVFDVTDDVTSGLVLSTPNGSYINTFTITATLGAASGSNKVLNTLAQVWGPVD